MKFAKTGLEGAYVIEPAVFKDNRGFFMETFNSRVFEEHGINPVFVQDNYSFSQPKGVIRGLHFQYPPHAQSKLVMVMSGSIFDVILDLRKGSSTYGTWFSVVLTNSPFTMIFVPKGFAHGFCTLEENTHVIYKVDALYHPAADGGIKWNDPELGIPWPTEAPVLSRKDGELPLFKDISFDS